MNKRIKIALAFIILCIIGGAIFLIIKLHAKNDGISKDVKERIPQCEEEVNEKELTPLEVDNSNRRRLNDDTSFKPFKIYLDLTFIKYQASLDEKLSKHIDQVIKSMEKAKNTLETIFLVKPFVTRWIVRAENLQKLGIEKFNENFFKKEGEPTKNLYDIGYDLYIFPKFGELNSMGSWGIYYKDTNKRPMIRIFKYGEVANSEIFARDNIPINVEGTVKEIIENDYPFLKLFFIKTNYIN